eukprot:1355533-Prymnesium_polylepis.1
MASSRSRLRRRTTNARVRLAQLSGTCRRCSPCATQSARRSPAEEAPPPADDERASSASMRQASSSRHASAT